MAMKGDIYRILFKGNYIGYFLMPKYGPPVQLGSYNRITGKMEQRTMADYTLLVINDIIDRNKPNNAET